MTLFEPCLALKLVESLENCLCTYTVSTMRVSEVACEIDLVRLYLLEESDDDVDVGLGTLSLLDSAGLIERQIEEVAVGLVIQTE